MRSLRFASLMVLSMSIALFGLLAKAQPALIDATLYPYTAQGAMRATPTSRSKLRLPFVLVKHADVPPTTVTATPMPRPPTPLPSVTPSPTPPTAGDPVLVGAGDIASCYVGNVGDEATAKLLDVIPGTVFTAGDNAYPDGTLDQFTNCYGPTWGRHKARTHPAAGNHEYHTAGAAGYFTYFGAAAGDPRTGYYSYDLGAWHIVVVNSNCSFIGGCQAGSSQEQWLRADLAAHPATCTLAYWHHPRFSSGFHGNTTEMQPIWQALYEAGADVVISAHSHGYERFAPQDPAGQANTAYGLREFVVGTGGDKLEPTGTLQPNSEVRNYTTHGVIKLTLHAASYDWQFIPVAGQTFTDAGQGTCHSQGPKARQVPQPVGALELIQLPLFGRLFAATR